MHFDPVDATSGGRPQAPLFMKAMTEVAGEEKPPRKPREGSTREKLVALLRDPEEVEGSPVREGRDSEERSGSQGKEKKRKEHKSKEHKSKHKSKKRHKEKRAKHDT